MHLDEPEIKTREESPISLRLSGPNGRLSRYDQSDEEPASNGDSAVHSPRRQLTRKEKGKKVSDSGTDRNESDRRNPTPRELVTGLQR